MTLAALPGMGRELLASGKLAKPGNLSATVNFMGYRLRKVGLGTGKPPGCGASHSATDDVGPGGRGDRAVQPGQGHGSGALVAPEDAAVAIQEDRRRIGLHVQRGLERAVAVGR